MAGCKAGLPIMSMMAKNMSEQQMVSLVVQRRTAVEQVSAALPLRGCWHRGDTWMDRYTHPRALLSRYRQIVLLDHQYSRTIGISVTRRQVVTTSIGRWCSGQSSSAARLQLSEKLSGTEQACSPQVGQHAECALSTSSTSHVGFPYLADGV